MFGGQIDHNECEPPSSDKPELGNESFLKLAHFLTLCILVEIGVSSVRNTIKCYIEVFGHPPPEWIWPDTIIFF